MRVRGAFSDALEELAAAAERYVAAGESDAAGVALAESGDVHRILGDLDASDSTFERAIEHGFEFRIAARDGVADDDEVDVARDLRFAVAVEHANLLAGHNGFLTAALLAGALALLDTRPLMAGLLFGLLAYKPQFGLMIPLVLLITERWRAIGGAALSVIALSLLSTVLFGADIWRAFLSSEQFTRTVVLEQGQTGFYKILSMFAWVRMWGGPVPLAYAAQGLVTVFCGFALSHIWRRAVSQRIKGAALCIAAILATPYSLDYDLMALAPAIGLLAADNLTLGFRPYEKAMIAALWLMPFFARARPALTLIPIAVPVMIAALAMTLRYAASRAPGASFAKA